MMGRSASVLLVNVYGRYKYNGVSFTHWAFEDHKPGMGHFDNIEIENMFVSCCAKRPGFDWCGTILFQGGVESVGHVTIRNLRRVDAPDARNDIPTVNIGRDAKISKGMGVKIDTLILDNVNQRLPDGRPLVCRGPDVKIRNFIVREDGRRAVFAHCW